MSKPLFRIVRVLYALVLITAATSTPALAKSGPQVKVAASVAGIAQRGKNTWVMVRVTIPRPYHANSNPASQAFLIPTSVTIASASGIKAGTVHYPKGQMKKFSFSDKPISVYEGTIVVRVPLAVTSSAKPGVHKLSGTVRYQACDDKNCYIPANSKFNIALSVK